MLDVLKIVGAFLGIIAFIWKVVDLFSSYLYIHLDLSKSGSFILAKTTVENKSLLQKKIDNAILLVGPENENPIDTYNQLVTANGIEFTANYTNDIASNHLQETICDEQGRMMIPLEYFYSENVAIGDERLSYSVPMQNDSFEVGVPYSVRFFIWDKKRLHRSTHDCFILHDTSSVSAW